ncbi:hypothetical protein WEI85_02625 [Actinomycetes bacterium KLBMP 9797]
MSDAWEEYVAAARRLDAVRRGAAVAGRDQAQAARQAREELSALRARLTVERGRLAQWGVPESELQPTPAEVSAAAESMAGGPSTVRAALGRAGAMVDGAATTLAGGPGLARGRAETPVWLRNLLVYGPFGLVVLLVQIALYATAGTDLPQYAVLCGLTMPAAAFGLGWLTIGWSFDRNAEGKVDRTPLLGIAVCGAPVLVTCMGVGLLSLVT